MFIIITIITHLLVAA